ncbi:MAG: tetratricopeptide repeat protein [Polyangiaceae bacterium]
MGAQLSRRWRSVLAVLALAMLGAPRVTYAQDSERFGELVSEATRAFGDGDFERAEQLASQAYELKADPRLLYNIARAREARGNHAGAIDAYQRYLAADPTTSDASVVKGRIKALTAQMAQRIRLEAEQHAGAGRRSEARHAFAEYLELVPNAPDRAKIEAKIHELEGPAPEPKRDTPPTSGAQSPSLAPWFVAGGGVLMLGAGGVLAAVSRQKYDDADAARTGEDLSKLQDEGDQYTIYANMAFVVGGIATAAGLSWWLLTPRPSNTSGALRLQLGLGTVSASGSF